MAGRRLALESANADRQLLPNRYECEAALHSICLLVPAWYLVLLVLSTKPMETTGMASRQFALVTSDREPSPSAGRNEMRY